MTRPSNKKKRLQMDSPVAVIPTRLLPNHDEIARGAFTLYEDGGRQEGLSEQNWLQAERDILGSGTTYRLASASETMSGIVGRFNARN